MIRVGKRWTDKEVDYLAERVGAGVNTIPHIAKRLRRSEDAVRSKLQRLGVIVKHASDDMTVIDLSKALGVSRYTVDYWISDLGLKSFRRGPYRFINPAKFWKWAEKNKSRINWSKVHPLTFGIEPDWVQDLRGRPERHLTAKRRWTEKEIADLKFYVSKYEYTLTDLAVKLNRSESAIRRKVYDLGLSARPVYKDAEIKYSREAKVQAVKMSTEGRSIQEIAEAIEGSAHYITDRIKFWEEQAKEEIL